MINYTEPIQRLMPDIVSRTPALRFIDLRQGLVLRPHAPEFYEDVAAMTRAYLTTRPDRELFEFLRWDFSQLQARFGGVTATTFSNFPSFPQRYMAPLTLPIDADAGVKVEPVKRLSQPLLYTERDLHVRHFTGRAALRQSA